MRFSSIKIFDSNTKKEINFVRTGQSIELEFTVKKEVTTIPKLKIDVGIDNLKGIGLRG